MKTAFRTPLLVTPLACQFMVGRNQSGRPQGRASRQLIALDEHLAYKRRQSQCSGIHSGPRFLTRATERNHKSFKQSLCRLHYIKCVGGPIVRDWTANRIFAKRSA